MESSFRERGARGSPVAGVGKYLIELTSVVLYNDLFFKANPCKPLTFSPLPVDIVGIIRVTVAAGGRASS